MTHRGRPHRTAVITRHEFQQIYASQSVAPFASARDSGWDRIRPGATDSLPELMTFADFCLNSKVTPPDAI